jgi:hypothetical protein
MEGCNSAAGALEAVLASIRHQLVQVQQQIFEQGRGCVRPVHMSYVQAEAIPI